MVWATTAGLVSPVEKICASALMVRFRSPAEVLPLFGVVLVRPSVSDPPTVSTLPPPPPMVWVNSATALSPADPTLSSTVTVSTPPERSPVPRPPKVASPPMAPATPPPPPMV